MTEPVESDPRELSDAELLRRLRFWRGEGKGAVSASALANGHEAKLNGGRHSNYPYLSRSDR